MACTRSPSSLRRPFSASELDEKRERMHLPAQTPDEIGCRPRGAARRQQIVDDQHPLPFPHRIVVDLERIRAVLEIVGLAHRPGRQLARLANRREPGVNPIGDRRPEDEPAALDADDEIDPLADERRGEAVDRRAEADRVLQQRRDVVEEDAGLGKIGDAADLALEMLHGLSNRELQVRRPRHVVGTTRTDLIDAGAAADPAGSPARAAPARRHRRRPQSRPYRPGCSAPIRRRRRGPQPLA